MSKEMRTYLEWRCRMNWHAKYYRYIDTWIDNVLPYQVEYFEKEMRHLKERGIYNN